MKRADAVAAVYFASVVLVACASGTGQETTAIVEPAIVETTTLANSNTATLATSTTDQAASTTLPIPGTVLVESTHYPYSLTLPTEDLLIPFQPATIPWDGKARVVRDRPFLDVFALPEGFIFILGVEWPDDVESLAQMFVDHGEQQHGCSQAKNQREVTAGGAPAVVFTVDACGPENATFVRLVALHDGFGLIAFSETFSGQEGADIDQVVERLFDLEWRMS